MDVEVIVVVVDVEVVVVVVDVEEVVVVVDVEVVVVVIVAGEYNLTFHPPSGGGEEFSSGKRIQEKREKKEKRKKGRKKGKNEKGKGEKKSEKWGKGRKNCIKRKRNIITVLTHHESGEGNSNDISFLVYISKY